MKHNATITIVLVIFFLLSQILGLAVIDKYVNKEVTAQTGQTVYEELPYGIERPEAQPATAFFFIVSALFIGTILFLLLIKFKKRFLWKLWFFLAVTLTLSIAFAAFIPSAAAGLFGLILATLKVFRPSVVIHNFTELFVYGGLAVIFVPLLNIVVASVLLIIIAIYDAFAVWKSKHMIKMAKFQTESKMFAGLLIPYKLVDLRKKITKIKKGKAKKAAKEAKPQKVQTAVLGGGDMAFPLMFAGVVLTQMGFFKALIVPACTTIALILLLVLAKKDRFYPAMPFLAAGCFVGYLIATAL